jgi:hypothetical protein
MGQRVFVSGANVKGPGVRGLTDLADLVTGRASAPLTPCRVAGQDILLGEEIALDRQSPFYPQRSDEKVMRPEVIAATMGVCELFQDLGLATSPKSDIPLFVAGGLTLERHIGDGDWFAKAFQATRDCPGGDELNRRLSQFTPPLLALRTLTNATSSFIAQQTGVAGDNTTFGNTSLSGFYALKEGFDAVGSGTSTMAVVGGASRGGLASYFMYRNFFDDNSGWKESTASAFLLLESESSLRARGALPLGELTELRSSGTPPVLTGRDTMAPFGAFALNGADASLAVYSGAFCQSEHERLGAAVSGSWARAVSIFESLGNAGASNIFLDILTGLALAGPRATVDCLDRDPYSRDSLVRITPTAT